MSGREDSDGLRGVVFRVLCPVFRDPGGIEEVASGWWLVVSGREYSDGLRGAVFRVLCPVFRDPSRIEEVASDWWLVASARMKRTGRLVPRGPRRSQQGTIRTWEAEKHSVTRLRLF